MRPPAPDDGGRGVSGSRALSAPCTAHTVSEPPHAIALRDIRRSGDPGPLLPHARVSTAPTRFGSVVFDCDSTLSAIEGIDELAGARREAVAELTAAAMRGEVALEEVYGRRLELIQPSRADVDALAARYVDALVPDAIEVIARLRGEGIVVRVMSGGLLPPVCAVARELGLSSDDVAAVDIRFDESGRFAGFDVSSPLARAGGKRTLLEQWRAEIPAPVMFVGDGATDLEAKPAADLFVAFAGFVDRPNVTGAADVVVRACTLAPIFALAVGDPPAGGRARELFDRGAAELRSNDHAAPRPAAPATNDATTR